MRRHLDEVSEATAFTCSLFVDKLTGSYIPLVRRGNHQSAVFILHVLSRRQKKGAYHTDAADGDTASRLIGGAGSHK